MLLESLAKRIGEITFDSLSAAAVTTAKQAILDTMGVTLAGSVDECTLAAARTLQPAAADGPALVFGEMRRVDVLSAAFINGVAAHALDFDDRGGAMGGPLSAAIVPALWTLAPGIHGRAFIAAYAAGAECATKLAPGESDQHDEARRFPAARLAACGSAAACAHLLRLVPGQIAVALVLAVETGSRIETNLGTVTPFQIGQAARDGLRAALRAQAGTTPDPQTLEHSRRLFPVATGASALGDSGVLVDGVPSKLADPYIAFKLHPCCESAHAALDALLHLRAAHDLTPKYVRRIECRMHPGRLSPVDRPDPIYGAEARLSLHYVLARALKQGLVRLADFSDEAVLDPAIRGAMRKIHVASDPQARPDPDHSHVRLRVTTVRGDVFEHAVDGSLGRDRNHPPPGALEAKFHDCAETVLDPESVEALIGYCTELDNIPDVGDVLDVIAAGVMSAHDSAPWTTRRAAR